MYLMCDLTMVLFGIAIATWWPKPFAKIKLEIQRHFLEGCDHNK